MYLIRIYRAFHFRKNSKGGFAKMSENFVWTPIEFFPSRSLREGPAVNNNSRSDR